ncbi:hypothetical protein SAMN04487906_1302 [Zhouia amylolytica]|uniref:Uncharacterized protein n=1 Tax=Zhouia amylolytica TaxID=376730 RepID=A0A1I6RT45_9FLAO|nr:hypothetical protein [Zhouia amylolytica]SFS67852.1 hypothetical protein SAMN04487906_1302 [Zhouia amylolytica]
MSFGAGHIQDMINRMKQNRSLRPSARAKFKDYNRAVIYGDGETQLQFKTVSREKLIQIKKNIQQRARIDRRRELIVYGLILGIIIFLLFLWW